MQLSFIQLSGFTSNWKRMKFTDMDLRALERALADAPDVSPVISGTGGLRKIRFAPVANAGGKSGPARERAMHTLPSSNSFTSAPCIQKTRRQISPPRSGMRIAPCSSRFDAIYEKTGRTD